MFSLGVDYVISSVIWLTILGVFIFAFRKKIFKHFYTDQSLEEFTQKLEKYLKETYPKISFDYSIISQVESEPNPDTRKFLITSDIVNQFSNLSIDKNKLPTQTPQSMQWQGYVFNCEPNKNKLPPDWDKRKSALLHRDNKRCIRCSKKLTTTSMEVHMLRSLEDGGKYYLENLITLCKDCKKLLHDDPKKKSGLTIKEELEDMVAAS